MADTKKTSDLFPAFYLAILVIGLLFRCCQYDQAKKAFEEQKAQETAQKTAEADKARRSAEEIRSQRYDTLGQRFTAEDDVRECTLENTLTFLIPSSWDENIWSGGDLLAFEADNYEGLFQAGIIHDICLHNMSDDEVIDKICADFDQLDVQRNECEQGSIGKGRWYRYPVRVKPGNTITYPYGFSEIILSGHDAYYINTLCYARDYTAEIHEEMLCILNSIDGSLEEPVFLAKQPSPPAAEGTMLNYLQQLGQFQTYTVSGTGNDVIVLPRDVAVLTTPSQCLLTVDYEGTGPLTVSLRSDVVECEDQTLVKADGPYHGTVSNLGNVGHQLVYTQLSINAEGEWKVAISPIADTPRATQHGTYTGDMLVYLDESSISSLSFIHAGYGAFDVYAVGMTKSKQLVDITGGLKVTVDWDDPNTLLIVHCDGMWNIAWE